MPLGRALLLSAIATVLASAAILALASRRILAEQAAYASGGATRCTPAVLNRSAVLPGSGLSVSPLPDSYDASPQTQISMLGAPASAIGAISVSGTQTGEHSGRLLAYSQGDGASFVPSTSFLPGETVTVRGTVKVGTTTRPFAYRFAVAHREPVDYAASASVTVPHDYNEMQHFHSRPELEPPLLVVGAQSSQSTPGDVFAAPYAGPGPSGPMIFEEDGNLVWFHPLAHGTEATNLQVQQYDGQPVLTWWQGRIPPQGFGQGEEIIDNSAYQQIGRVQAGNGDLADLHEFHITPQGTALLTVFQPLACDLNALGGPSDGAVTASIFQEIDLKTGLVRREWNSLDHVAMSESYSSAIGSSTIWPFDYFHLNSIDQLADGLTLISARNTSALYELNTQTGEILTRIGGKRSSVKLAPGASTAFQHDATVLPNGTISVFDNGGVPKVHPQSRGLVLNLNTQTNTDSVVAEYDHSAPPLLSGSQGNVQTLTDGGVFIGWGAEPYFSEYSAGGQLLYDAHWHGSYQSYRSFRFQWTGSPSEPPAIAAAVSSAEGEAGHTVVYASWNGDTRTASWQVLAGPTPQQLTPVASAARDGFETAIATPVAEGYVAVQALNPEGAVLGKSPTIAG
ncbi:MAG TPA: arylsulfotransferase family protein [Solirubrobacteraceae bacterium]|nr:arylsulfotransferase family protein [Solirubrobacteraceae bacterium]